MGYYRKYLQLNMRKPQSVKAMETLGRTRLSKSFYMRDFMYSEISNFYGVPNIPDNPDLAIEVGKVLCEQLLEPLQDTFGHLAIRSAYRSIEVNQLGNDKKLGCGSNESNYAAHIWDRKDAQGNKGAMACVVIPWFTTRYQAGADWRSLAYWIHDHLPYNELQFFPNLCAFNIGWRENSMQTIYSYIKPTGLLLNDGTSEKGKHAFLYKDFPLYKQAASL